MYYICSLSPQVHSKRQHDPFNGCLFFMNLSWNMRHRKFLNDWFMNLFVPNREPFMIVCTKISVFVRLKKKVKMLWKGSPNPHESLIMNFQRACFMNHGWVHIEPFDNTFLFSLWKMKIKVLHESLMSIPWTICSSFANNSYIQCKLWAPDERVLI